MENKQKIFTETLTSEELVSYDGFIALLKCKNIKYDENKYNQSYIIRFLRARKCDLNKTLEMFLNFIKWRSDNDVDNIENFKFPELEKVKAYYPHAFHKTDLNGRPIYIDVLGELKVDELFKVTSSERLMLYQVQQYERLVNRILPDCSRKAEKYVTQTLSIIDLKKLSSKHLSKKVYNFLKLTSHNSQNNYPELLGQLYVINAGLLFKAAWAVCKAFVDDKTAKKIVTLGSDYKKKIFELVHPDNLPKFLGGNCLCEPYGCLYSDAGPWNDGHTRVVEPIKKDEDEKDEEADIEILENDQFEHDDEDRENLDEISKQLNENMILSQGQQENTNYKLQDGQDFGDTPINTQEGGNYDD